MCGPPKDNSAEIARRQAEENNRRIAAGRAKVDETFGGFDDQFFDQRRQEYAGHYMPQLDRQFQDAHESSVKQLAQRGSLDSSVGAKMMADLQQQYQTQRGNVASRAFDHSQNLRSDFDNSRQDIYSQLEAGLSPADAAARAQTAAGRFSTEANYSPLGDIFANTLNQFGQAAILQQSGFRGTGLPQLSPGRQQSGSSLRVVQ